MSQSEDVVATAEKEPVQAIAQKFTASSLIRFTMPSILMMLFIAIYSTLGSIFASQFIGEDALSAMSVTFPLVSAVLAVAIMFTMGANAIIAANLGEGNHQTARENLTHICIVGTLVGVVLMVLTLTFDEQILHFLGSTPKLDVYAIPYLRTYALSFPFVFWQIASQHFFVTIGKPVMGMNINFLGGILTILAGYILTGVLKIGIVGIAIGVGIGFLVPGAIFIVYFLVNHKNSLYFVKPKRHPKFLLLTCTNGSSEMVTNIALAIITMTMNLIMRKLAGEDGIAAASVIIQIQFLMNSIYIGFGAGVAPIFAYAKGEQNHERTKNVFWLAIRFIMISSVILSVVCMLFSGQIVTAFIATDSSAYAMAKLGFTLFSLAYIFRGFCIFASIFFTSVSNGRVSAIVSFLRTFLFILGMMLILPLMFGTTGVWLSIPVAETLGAIVAVYYFKRYRKEYHY